VVFESAHFCGELIGQGADVGLLQSGELGRRLMISPSGAIAFATNCLTACLCVSWSAS